jgi:NAD(P)-dependent dehydrogenase (short-subunit alcohol dehydrogenase family)
MRLEGKTALITGGSSGIGLETARLFIREGARVAITGRDKARLDAAVSELGPNAVGFQADAGSASDMDAVVAALEKSFGRLDILFANAGIGGTTPLGATAAESFDAIVRTNLTGVFLTVQSASKLFAPGGSVVLNSSVHAVLGAPQYSAYAASKAGVRSMGRVLASELAPRGVRVNVVTPGAADTPIWDKYAPNEQALAALHQRIADRVPQGRIGKPEDTAKAVLFLASDDSSHVTGSELVVDGGATGAPAGAPLYLR